MQVKVAWGRGAWEGVRENLEFQAEDFMLRSVRSCQRVETVNQVNWLTFLNNYLGDCLEGAGQETEDWPRGFCNILKKGDDSVIYGHGRGHQRDAKAKGKKEFWWLIGQEKKKDREGLWVCTLNSDLGDVVHGGTPQSNKTKRMKKEVQSLPTPLGRGYTVGRTRCPMASTVGVTGP